MVDNKNKKGFTLIELLAIIVILASIALIAVPVTLNILESAKKGAAQDSAHEYIKAIQNNLDLAEYNDNYSELEDGEYDILSLDVNVKGAKPTYGDIKLLDGKITDAFLCIQGYIVTYDGTKVTSHDKCPEEPDKTGPEIIIGQISGTTNSITIPFTAQDEQSGIKEVKCYYSLDDSYSKEGLVKNNECTIKGLKSNELYNFKIVATNKGGQISEVTGSKKTIDFSDVTLTLSSIDWEPSKTVTIIGSTTGAVLEYKVVKCVDSGSSCMTKIQWSEYKEEITINWTASIEEPTYIYARLNDGTNTSDEETLTITTVDASAPSLELGVASKTTNSITIPLNTNGDKESGISSTTCKYGTENGKYTETGIVNNTKTGCTISNVKNNTTYYYEIVTTNNAGLSTTKTGSTSTEDLGTCSIEISDEGKWTTSKTAKISKTGEGTLQYRIVNGTTVKTDWTNYSNVATIDWASNTTTPTHVYCRVTDGTNIKDGSESKTITKIDTSAPNLGLDSAIKTTNSIKIPISTNSDLESGISSTTCKYGTEDGIYTSTGVVNSAKTECTINGVKNNTTYYYQVTTTNGANISTTKTGDTITKDLGTCSIEISEEGKWTTSKTATISKTGEGTLQYRVISGTTVKTDWTNYSNVVTINWAANTTTPTHVYCRITDGTNIKDGSESKTITKVDITAASTTTPSVAASPTNPTKAAVVTNKQTDAESGISSIEYGYSISETGTYTWQTSNTITGLNQGGTYYFKTRVKNGAGTGWTESGATQYKPDPITTCSITMSNAGVWKTSKTATITGSQTGVTLQYRVVSGTTEKVAWTTISSGKTQTINWAANTTTPTYVYCRMTDGTSTVNGSTYTETTIDTTAANTTAPSVAASTTNPTKAVVVTLKQADGESGISSKEYGYSTSETGTYTWQTSNTITGLTQGGTYYFKTRVKNGAGTGWTESVATQYKPDPITPCSITMNTTAWKASKTATITGSQTGVTLQYRVVSGTTEKVAWTTISSGKTQTINWAANTTTPTYVYCRMTDGTTTVNGTTYTETKVDITAASTTVPTIAASTTNPTKAAVVTNKQTDAESGISSVEYGYSTASNGTYTWGTSSTISGLTQGQTYYFKTRVKNGAGTGWTETAAVPYGVTTMTTCLISMNTTAWASSKTATITGSQTGVTLQYRVVSGTTEKVAWTTISSGKTQTINWAANTTTPTYVYCRMTDGTTTVNGTTYTETKVDITAASTTAPTVAASTTNPTKAAVVTNKQTDAESGISSVEYGYSTSESGTYTWGTSNTITGLTQGGTYYFKTRVKNGAGTGWTESTASAYKTTPMSTCTVTMNTTAWASSKTATITGSQTGVTLQYRVVSGTTVKTDWTTATSGKTVTINWAANATTPTYVYCRMTDGTTTIDGTSYTETHVDPTAASTTAPSVAASPTNPTKAAVVTNKQTDAESGISSIEYGYSTSETGTYTWNTSNTITGLTQGGTYYFKTRVKNGAGTGWTESAATKFNPNPITTCNITVTPTDLAKSKTATITGSQTGVTLQYRVVSGTTEKVAWTTISSGKTQTINWDATTSTPTYIYCRMTDGTTTVNGTTYTETKTVVTPPTCSIAATSYTLTSVATKTTCTTNAGVKSYNYSIDGSSYTSSTSNTYTFNSIHVSTIKVKVIDNAGNETIITMKDADKNTVYNGLYNLLNNKYTEIVNNQFLASHPIGSIYVTTASDENTAAKIASKYGGTWEVFGENRTLRGTTGTASSTGGASTVTLTTSHLPSHTHSIPSLSGTAASNGAHTHTLTAKGSVSSSFTGSSATTSGDSHTHTVTPTGSIASTFTGGSVTLSTKSLTGTIKTHNSEKYSDIHDVGGIVASTYTNSNSYFTPLAVGANGGAQSIGQMKIDASHNHTLTAKGSVSSSFTGASATTSSDSHTHTLTAKGSVSSSFTGASATSSSSGAHTHNVTTTASTSGSTGSGSSFSIVDPYITVYMYKRVN